MLRGLKGLVGTTVRLGSGFSGCEIASRVLSEMRDYWEETFGIVLDTVQEFVCEKDTAKRDWLVHNHTQVKRVFTDMANLSQAKAWCQKANREVLVPGVDLFIAGFVCTDRSRFNSKRAKHAHCVQASSGKTGTTFAYCAEYITACRPTAVVLENVVGLSRQRL